MEDHMEDFSVGDYPVKKHSKNGLLYVVRNGKYILIGKK
jgi:hypothetical protein